MCKLLDFYNKNSILQIILLFFTPLNTFALLFVIWILVVLYEIKIKKKSFSKCTYCGAEIEKDKKFCGQCGKEKPNVRIYLLGGIIGFICFVIYLLILSGCKLQMLDFISMEIVLIVFTIGLFQIVTKKIK
jgi:hypothetical protein